MQPSAAVSFVTFRVNRDDIQDYLNLLSVMVNPPHNKYEKVKKNLELGLEKPVLVRFRD